MHLDHLFVCVADPSRAQAEAKAAGLVETHRRVHRGQGTANVCFRFSRVYIEFLWEHDATELAMALAGLPSVG